MIMIMTIAMIACSNDDDTPETSIITTITVKNFEVAIDENPTIGQEIGTIDASTNQRTLSYNLKAENPEGAISIDAKTGKITVKDHILFDYETRTKITATLLIKNGSVSKEANIIINLKDVSETIITVKDFEVTIDENPTIGQEIGTIDASTNQGTLSYSLKTENPEGAISIDAKTGKITVKDHTPFDYETRTKITATLLIKNGDISKENSITINLKNIGTENIAFADANFKKALIEHTNPIDTNTDGEISEDEANVVKELRIDSKSITDLSGIEYFTELTHLWCRNNQLTTLDVSKNTKLTNLYCNNNQITTLDISKNTELTYLWCSINQLTALDVSKNTELIFLSFDNNQLTALDVSKNTKLTYLYCNRNQLTALDVSKNIKLIELSCNHNQLTALDVSKNTKLIELLCNHNQLTALNMKNGNNDKFSWVELQSNTALSCIQVDDPDATYLTGWYKDNTASYSSDCTP